MADYTALGSFSTGGASALSGDVIQKLREAEEKSIIAPLDTKLETAETEAEKILEIETQVTAFKDVMKYFEVGQKDNVFTQKLMDTTGSSVVFESDDTSALEDGKTSVHISQLAQRDVYQGSTIGDKDATVASGTLSIQVGTDTALEFDTSAGMTYSELAAEINLKDDLIASVEQVGDNDYRLIVKSTDTGLGNKLTISGLDLGFDTGNQQVNSTSITPTDATVVGNLTLNGVTFPQGAGETYTDLVSQINAHSDFNATINSDNKIEITRTDNSQVTVDSDGLNLGLTSHNINNTVEAKNLIATVDGVNYNKSSNTIDLASGLSITALKEDEVGDTSTLSISKDTSAVVIAVEQMVEQYNKLTDIINTELNSSESSIRDKDSLRTILSDMKSLLFNDYGAAVPNYGTDTDDYGDIIKAHSNVTNNDKNLFNFGFELDREGHLSIDTETLNDGLEDKMEDLKLLFVGSYENKGLGTMMSEYVSTLQGYEGILYNYDLDIIKNKEDTEKEKEDAVKSLDTKYQIMAESFAAYGSLITQMEASFSGLKQMIAESVSTS